MKRIVISLLALIACATMAYSHDGNLVGMKGEVYYVDFTRGYDSFRTIFTAQGALEELYLESPTDHIVLDNITKVNGGFVGSWNGVRVTVSTSGGKITKATYSKDGKACTLTYTYNSAGFLANVRLTKSWTERNTVRNAGSARVNTNGYEKYMKQAQAALKKGNTAAYKKYLNLAQKAANSANVSVRQSTTTTTTSQKSSNDSESYTNYKIDQYGNWVSRIASGNNTETRKYIYTGNWIDKEKWEKDLLPKGNLNQIERFANSEAHTDTYKQKAIEEWNRLFMNQYTQSVWTSDKLIEYADKKIMTVENRETVLRPIRERMYAQQVLPQRDFAVLEKLFNKYKQSAVLNPDLRTKLTDAINKLRTDSVNTLVKRGQAFLADKAYYNAFNCARRALAIDPYNLEAVELSVESNYQLVLEKEIAKTVSDNDYSSFLTYNPYSKYTQDIKNRRTKFAYSLFDKNTSINEMETVVEYGADKAVVAPVYKKLKKAKFKEAHGGPWSLALSGGFGLGSRLKRIVPFSAGIGLRYGHAQKLLNIYAGAEYQQIGMDYRRESDDVRESYAKVQRITFPLLLKFNMFAFEEGTRVVYVSAGGNFNLLLNAKYEQHTNKKIAYNNTITPRFSVGLNLSPYIEAEMYYSMDKDVFYEDKVKDVKNVKGFFGAHFRIIIGAH